MPDNDRKPPIRKVLFCGLGSIGQRHLRNIRRLYGSEIEVIAFRARGSDFVLDDQGRIIPEVKLGDHYQMRMFNTLDSALNDQPDAVFITNPNVFHTPIALTAADAGCHLFIEKPLSNSLEGIDKLIEIVEKKKLTALVAYQFRFHPGLIKVKETLDSGRLGRLVAAHIVNGEYVPDWHPYEDYRETYPVRNDLGGGILHCQTHELDYCLWLFGMPRRVFAVGGHLSRLEADVEDSVSILQECESSGKPLPVHIHLDYLQRPPQRLCEIIGDEGHLIYNYYQNQITIHDIHRKATDTITFEGFERNQMFIDELKHFIDCIAGRIKPVVDLREGRRSVVIALAAHESMEKHHSVEVMDG